MYLKRKIIIIFFSFLFFANCLAEQQRDIIIVIGMHRSGTSVLTRALEVLDIYLGENLMSGHLGINDKGFYEDLDIYKINVSILEKLGCDWSNLTGLQDEKLNSKELHTLKREAKELITKKFLESQMRKFAFKDPRTSVLLPFWQKIFEELGIKIYYIVSLRNPLDVAKSLYKRDGFSYEKSSMLWINYYISIIEHIKDKKYVWVTYEGIMSDTKKEILSIADFLGISKKLNINKKKFLQYKQTFLEKKLHHNNSGFTSLKNSGLPDFVTKAYFLMLQIHEKKLKLDSNFFIKKWEKIKTSALNHQSS